MNQSAAQSIGRSLGSATVSDRWALAACCPIAIVEMSESRIANQLRFWELAAGDPIPDTRLSYLRSKTLTCLDAAGTVIVKSTGIECDVPVQCITGGQTKVGAPASSFSQKKKWLTLALGLTKETVFVCRCHEVPTVLEVVKLNWLNLMALDCWRDSFCR